ncbi:TPA: toll/interleukin-1 receptor domain-containing protein [Stenotrophomonas maltophilia]|uniref:toll/interleukin-1 receptor domain-containing protein n=1 Tax=Stenotrophomonas maltophilia TaxID=40324 RepID=UPI0013DB4647|nr:toll/interleukin-1 receptor domain-containing protein [Stenotrophomonas maltophilia]MBN4978348.1 toll/interleukin-1 receptor domain-containing protein [Stenotrophomonas maltophilia]
MILPSVFFSYCHADEELRDQLEKQLAMLKHQGIIETWHDRRIVAGQEIDKTIDEHINSDDIILLLVSPDFLASPYCYDREMKRALERHESDEATVIPVILRACEWHHAPFGKLMATPTDGKPVKQWADLDDAFLQVAKSVRAVAAEHARKMGVTKADLVPASAPLRLARPTTPTEATNPAPEATLGPRSSNLRLAKAFTQRDKDHFKAETFEYIAKHFENSLNELQLRNPGYEGTFRRVDANRFFATVYEDGHDVARATVYLGGMLGGIHYMQGETLDSNSYNEALTIGHDDQTLFLTSMGMSAFGSNRDQKLTQQCAAELLWEQLIGPLQSSSKHPRRR